MVEKKESRNIEQLQMSIKELAKICKELCYLYNGNGFTKRAVLDIGDKFKEFTEKN